MNLISRNSHPSSGFALVVYFCVVAAWCDFSHFPPQNASLCALIRAVRVGVFFRMARENGGVQCWRPGKSDSFNRLETVAQQRETGSSVDRPDLESAVLEGSSVPL